MLIGRAGSSRSLNDFRIHFEKRIQIKLSKEMREMPNHLFRLGYSLCLKFEK